MKTRGKLKLLSIFVTLLGVELLLQRMTTDFRGLGWEWQTTLVIAAMILVALPFAICMPVEMYKAWDYLGDRLRSLKWLVPGALASALLAGPFAKYYGVIPGILLTIAVSAVGSIIFWLVALAPPYLDIWLGGIDQTFHLGRELSETIVVLPPNESESALNRHRKRWLN